MLFHDHISKMNIFLLLIFFLNFFFMNDWTVGEWKWKTEDEEIGGAEQAYRSIALIKTTFI